MDGEDDTGEYNFETPPRSPAIGEANHFDEERIDKYQLEIEAAVTQFQDEAPIRHNVCADSDSESEHVPIVPVKRKHRIFKRREANLHLKKPFSCGVAFKEEVLDYALSTGYNIKQYRYDQMKLGYQCITAEECKWRVYCSVNKGKNRWEIKVFQDKHSCTSRNGDCAMMTDPIIARLFVDKIREEPDYFKPKKIQQLIREQFNGISATRNQCQEARLKALSWIKQEYADQFAHIKGYCEEILLRNPGSTAEVVTKPGPNGEDLFERFYVCFAGLKRSWKQNCRPLIGVDGTYLRGTMKGQLLVALGRDANNKIYPIAWAVVEVEDEVSWIWFVRMLKSDLELKDGDGFIIMSDRQKGLINAVKKEIPKAEHRKCVRHIYQNIKAEHGKKFEMKKFIWQLAWSYNRTQYEVNKKKLEDYDIDVYKDVMKRDPESWCLAFYKIDGKCCEDVENNSVESFNNTIVKAREKPVMPMLEMIRRLAMIRISRRFAEASDYQGKFTPYVKEFLDEEHTDAKDCKIYPGTVGKYEVVSGYDYESVNLNEWTCTCGKWQICGIPCVHAYGVILDQKKNPNDYVSHWFLTSRWKDTYSESINPLRGPGHWARGDISLVSEDPERSKKAIKEKRIKGKNESPTKKQSKTKKQKTVETNQAMEPHEKPKRTMHCTKCHGAGHNMRTCSNKVKENLSSQRPPADVLSQQSQTTDV